MNTRLAQKSQGQEACLRDRMSASIGHPHHTSNHSTMRAGHTSGKRMSTKAMVPPQQISRFFLACFFAAASWCGHQSQLFQSELRTVSLVSLVPLLAVGAGQEAQELTATTGTTWGSGKPAKHLGCAGPS